MNAEAIEGQHHKWNTTFIVIKVAILNMIESQLLLSILLYLVIA